MYPRISLEKFKTPTILNSGVSLLWVTKWTNVDKVPNTMTSNDDLFGTQVQHVSILVLLHLQYGVYAIKRCTKAPWGLTPTLKSCCHRCNLKLNKANSCHRCNLKLNKANKVNKPSNYLYFDLFPLKKQFFIWRTLFFFQIQHCLYNYNLSNKAK